MKKLIYIIFGVVILASLGIIFRDQIQATFFPIKEVHFHAGFQVYENGKQKSFSDIRYMHDKPCTGKPAPGEKVDEQMEKAHLHDLVGDVVHVHRENATWEDLFTNINYPIDPEKVEAYVNGKKANMILARKIQPYDSLVLFIGSHRDVKPYLDKQVAKAHIQEVEKRSETCGSTN